MLSLLGVNEKPSIVNMWSNEARVQILIPVSRLCGLG